MSTVPFPLPVPNGVVREPVRRARPLLFVSTSKLWTITYWSCLAAFALLPTYARYSLWIGPGLALTVAVCWHLVAVGRRLPWLPGLMAAMAGIQWVIAAWAAYRLGEGRGNWGMVVPAPEYFMFAVPSLFAYVCGLFLPFVISKRLPRAYDFYAPSSDRRLRSVCKGMIIVGVVTRVFVVPLAPGALKAAVMFVGGLGLVGALGLSIVRPRLWQWWVGTALLPVAYFNARDGQFLELLLWLIFVAVFCLYRRRIGILHKTAIAAIAFTAILVLNGGKKDYREDVHTGRLNSTNTASDVSQSFLEYASSPAKTFSFENVGYTIARFNEGWITSRLLAWTPANEPFANGETVWTALEAALLPRVLAPDKIEAGGRATVPRFTGIVLNDRTSMNLSIAGELYANWGLTGAWFGTFVVAMALGCIFLAITVRARRSVLWFAWTPFLFMGSVSPEMGLAEIFNSLSKSALVMFGLIAVLPSWRRALSPPRARASRRVATIDPDA